MKKILNLILGILVITLISGCGKNEETTSIKNFNDDVILSHLYIDDVKLSDINTLNDIFDKFNNSQVSYVSVCYSDKDECNTNTYDEVLNNQIDTTNITTLTFGIAIPLQNNILNLNFSTYYEVYKENKENSKYFSLMLLESSGVVKLDNAYLELLPLSDIEKNHTLADRSTSSMYYIDFENVNGDKYYLTGYPSSSQIEIFNVTERDNNI